MMGRPTHSRTVPDRVEQSFVLTKINVNEDQIMLTVGNIMGMLIEMMMGRSVL